LDVAADSGGPGQGAEFVVRFPLEAGIAEAVSAPRAQAAVHGTARLRVLLIEDNEDAAESLKQALELVGHEVEVASNGFEGLDKAHVGHPDVVLCDITLPGIDGFEVARRLRADPALSHPSPSLFAVSGHGGPDVVERSRQAGFEQYLAKPLDIAALDTVLRRTAHDLQN
jgi:CheY-like chemotaxis protein